MDEIEVECPVHFKVGGWVGDPSHSVTHRFTIGEVKDLLWSLGAEDWEDGPRCVREIVEDFSSDLHRDYGSHRPQVV